MATARQEAAKQDAGYHQTRTTRRPAPSNAVEEVFLQWNVNRGAAMRELVDVPIVVFDLSLGDRLR